MQVKFNLWVTMPQEFRCDCPFTSALDVLGDRWVLVIVKLMLIEGKETFKEFMESEEGIATNILTSRLKQLETLQIIEKTHPPGNKKTNLYLLTDRGLALMPLLLELALWSDQHLRGLHPGIADGDAMELLRSDKAAFASTVEQAYRAKRG